ncbi:MAG: hypothetical protein K8S23_11060 [Candidatus Cloacimonetes bacterium]|nr:hypothetical protein [Candidatus Cloacimonadota bacterium]
MEAIRLKEVVTDQGIYIDKAKLKKIKSKQVEIIILPVEEKSEGKKIMDFAGILLEKEADEMLNEVKKCRKIDKETWQ